MTLGPYAPAHSSPGPERRRVQRPVLPSAPSSSVPTGAEAALGAWAEPRATPTAPLAAAEDFDPAPELSLDAGQPHDFAQADTANRRELAADLDRPAPGPEGPAEVTPEVSRRDAEAAGSALTDALQGGESDPFQSMSRIATTTSKPALKDLRRANAYHLVKGLAAGSGLPCHVLSYDPEFEGVGRMAVALGDIETATHVCVLVPGMGSDPSNFDELVRRTRTVYDECGRVGPAAKVAVIAWQGYKAPRDIRAGKGEVGNDQPAKDGSRLLNIDLAHWRALWKNSTARKSAGLRAQPEITVNGFSYGSVVAGYALMRRTEHGGITDGAKGALTGTTREALRQFVSLFPPTAVAKKRMQGGTWTQAVTEGAKKTLPIAELAADPSLLSAAAYAYAPAKATVMRSVNQARAAYKSEPLGGGEADYLVLFGSPGTGRRAQHLNIPATRIFAAAHKHDTISQLNYFSIDPTHSKYDNFTGRVTRLKSEYIPDPTLSWKEKRERAHTSYYDAATETQPARESLTNLARIVTGNRHKVTTKNKRSGFIVEGHKSLFARPFTNPPTNSPLPVKATAKKTTKAGGATVLKRNRRSLRGESAMLPAQETGMCYPGFPKLTGDSDFSRMMLEGRGKGKFSVANGIGFFTSEFMDILTDGDEVHLKSRLDPLDGVNKRRVLVSEHHDDGSVDFHFEDIDQWADPTKILTHGKPNFIIVALISDTWHGPMNDLDMGSMSYDWLFAEVTDELWNSFPAAATDFDDLNKIMRRNETEFTIGRSAAATKQTIDAVRKHTQRSTEQTYSDENYANALAEGRSLKVFGSARSKTGQHFNSGEVYLVDAGTSGMKIETKTGSGKAFALNDPACSFLHLPPASDFKKTPIGGRVKCPPPLSTSGDRLPILALFGDHRLIGIIPMDNKWHSITFDTKSLIEAGQSIFGAIVTSRSEASALPPGIRGEKLLPYSADIRSDENDQIAVTEKWFTELEHGPNPMVDASFDWRGLARSTDPTLAVLKDLGIPDESVPVAKVMLKTIETAEKTPLTDAAAKAMAASREYVGSINRVRPFHRHVHPTKYADGRIPLDTEVIEDLKTLNPDAWTVSYRKEWAKAKLAVSNAQQDFDKAVVLLNSELKTSANRAGAGVRTDDISVPTKSPSRAFNSAFMVLLAANLGISIFGGGIAEGDTLHHAVAAGSSIAVAMPLIENSLTALGKTAAAGKVAKAAPVVSLVANVLSLSNNLRADVIDGWAVSFDLMGISADVLALLALKFAALSPLATGLGMALAIPSIAYMLYHWGNKLPHPDDFAQALGSKLVAGVTTSLEDHRVNLHQVLKGTGCSDRDIAGLWNSTERSRTSKALIENFNKQVTSSPVTSGLSLANQSDIQDQIEAVVPNRSGYPASVRFRVPERVLLKLYDELTKYCINKMQNTSPDALNRLSFSFRGWLATHEGQRWVAEYRRSYIKPGVVGL
ncbi:alpha/beta hydrolase [Streptomyces sp. NPDC051183]|uniref:alpha/beta hydrolase n=1 Tax=Streptomyces sp. NPDC051183 TaxID=3155165 RepID=UPI003422AAA0